MSALAIIVTDIRLGCIALLGSFFLFLIAVILSIRKQKAQNEAEYKKQIAEKTWISFVRGNLGSRKMITLGYKGSLKRVIDPLADSDKQRSTCKAKCVFVGDAIEFERYTREHGGGADVSEDVIPVFYLEPGHDVLFLPNVEDEVRL